MKTIGVLGGLGPQATMDFEARFHRAAQARLPQAGNSGYPPMIVYYFREPPVLTDENFRPLQPIQPNPRLLQVAQQLGDLADFLVITANGPHAFRREIEAASGRRVLSMIDLALDAVAEHGWQRVGVLGLGRPTVYLKPLAERDVEVVSIDEEHQKQLDGAIICVMEGRNGEAESTVAADAVKQLRRQGADGIILGCTELTLLLTGELGADDLINPGALLAEAAVAEAIS